MVLAVRGWLGPLPSEGFFIHLSGAWAQVVRASRGFHGLLCCMASSTQLAWASDSMAVSGQPDFFEGAWLLPEQVLPGAGSNRTVSQLRDTPGPVSLPLSLS